MKIVKDENNQQWEVYTLKKWSFVLLIPVVYDLIILLLQSSSSSVNGIIPYRWLALGVIAFIIINADYIWAARVGVYPNQGQSVHSKRTPFKIWIKRSNIQ